MHDHPDAPLHRRLARLEDTLKRIIEWKLPQVRTREGDTVSLGVAWGSNGERDYFRKMAQEALDA